MGVIFTAHVGCQVVGWFLLSVAPFLFIHLSVVKKKKDKKWFMSTPVYGHPEDLMTSFFFFFKWFENETIESSYWVGQKVHRAGWGCRGHICGRTFWPSHNNINSIIPRRKSFGLLWLVLEFAKSWGGWHFCNRVSFRLKFGETGGGRRALRKEAIKVQFQNWWSEAISHSCACRKLSRFIYFSPISQKPVLFLVGVWSPAIWEP